MGFGALSLAQRLIGGGLAILLLVAAVLWYGSSRFHAGEASKDAEYKAASALLHRQGQESANAATRAAAERQVVHDQQVQQQAERIRDAEENGSSSFDILFGS